MRSLLVLMLSFLLFMQVPLCSVSAGEKTNQEKLKETPVNSFRYIGNHLVCKSDSNSPEEMFAKCLRFGKIRIGVSFRSIESNYGKAWKEIAQPDGIIASAYLICAKPDCKAYWVFGHKNDEVKWIQLTGNYSHPDYNFSSIKLKDSEETVLEILGPNHSIQDVREIGGYLWDYNPFPISIEFIKNKVYSIRIGKYKP
jgi:hypothetical protein